MKLYTVKEVAKILRVSEYELREKVIKPGKIKTIIVGSTKIPDFELERFIQENTGTGKKVM